MGVVELGEEGGAVHAVERVRRPTHDLGEVVPGVEVRRVGQLVDELSQDRHGKVFGSLFPVELVFAAGGGAVPIVAGANSVKEKNNLFVQ